VLSVWERTEESVERVGVMMSTTMAFQDLMLKNLEFPFLTVRPSTLHGVQDMSKLGKDRTGCEKQQNGYNVKGS
jgi:hypothetical protein